MRCGSGKAIPPPSLPLACFVPHRMPRSHHHAAPPAAHLHTPPFCSEQGPFSYEALPPDQIQFVPLKQKREFKADELMQVGEASRVLDGWVCL